MKILFLENQEKLQEVVLLNNNYTPQYPTQSNPPAYQDVTIRIKPVDYSKQNDYLACSILNLFFCGICLGIPALIFSIKARDNYRFGKYLEAKDNAGTAKKLNIIAFAIGSICFVLAIIFNFLLLYTFSVK